jgi:CBS domain containing-hemolysin-like protein
MLYIELVIVVALILLNGLLALAELAIVSSRRARLQALVDREVIGSRRALTLATDPGWRFEVIDLDGRRIDKILARRIGARRRRAAV